MPILSEAHILNTLSPFLASPAVLNDDTYYDPTTRMIYTTDMLVAGQHFDEEYFTPQDIGWRTAAVNISDIAATGGQLRYVLVSLGLPKTTDTQWIEGFYQGLHDAVTTYGGLIIGGDTVASPVLTINLTAIGQLPKGHSPGIRANAKPGDIVFLSGSPGISALGLHAFQHHLSNYSSAKAHHLRPAPHIGTGLTLSKKFERFALMDTSDGLADAVLKMAHASNVGIELAAGCIPIHPELQTYAKRNPEHSMAAIWDMVLYGGEDFGLFTALPCNRPDDITRAIPDLLPIGHVVALSPEEKPYALLLNPEAQERIELLPENTYQHFSGSLHANGASS